MLLWGRWKVVAGLAGLALSLELLLRYMRRRKPIREVLFFPAPVTCIEPVLYPMKQCSCPLPHTDSAFSRLLLLLLRAQRSLELCVFTFSCPSLARAVLLLHSRGVRVRVITDNDYMAASGSQIGPLRSAGVAVRHDQSSGYMHHKFAVVDGTVVLTGSLNWTVQATQTNRENILITDDRVIVKAYQQEFERLWQEYDPASYDFFPEKENK
ncbi:mitochondrial cardiolipin hydrolase [Xenopus tropicalis]|uniref:Mitochondrial cardiolipin hydrolase n=1 Tax=Xenopus tropicalis TaxID=8364 RepID=PLD6_XENTR|nr:mitochondrial cardiolipin hydrolase [Xenopus tropicalis]Q28DT3.2 RecName: Full=Mitochondrial cardiolipin hydrolase; AltName: Full=Choline phosphatase 6; AltName: Full=Mitochondrial phospholipase; Short=MitoPLD; AltName: Full=Phosphatidylcholine-hydrolyzing phospholipase D6; AltName: Full=Phospholipase D6; Short=PLD 6 [Xenopus tropicalis]AAI61584.1 LOC549629 protein [Xenopus tropicalis]|eukprot:NP_001016875.2 mitochondrial cardiolipin hydrolase [Xenopus tropicalis]